MNSEQLNNNPETAENSGTNPWMEAMRDMPPFGSVEQSATQEQEKQSVSEQDVIARMLEVSSDKQDELVEYLNAANSGKELTGSAFYAYENFLDEQKFIDDAHAKAEWKRELNDYLDRLETMDKCISVGMEALGEKENAGKTLAEIFDANATRIQNYLNNPEVQVTDKQREDLTKEYKQFKNLSDWAPIVRKGLEDEKSDNEQDASTSESYESYYKDAQEMLNDGLFNSDWKPRLSEDLSGDAKMFDFPKYMAEGYGLQESIDACNAKLQTAKIATPEENNEIYNALNDAWLDMEDDANRDEDKNKEAYAQLMRETLDSLVGYIKDFVNGDVQSLESVADHRIAQETKSYLEALKTGKLTEKYKERYAKRVTALSEVRSALHNQKLNMQTDTESQNVMSDAGEVEENAEKIGIDTKIENLQEELKKREEALHTLESRDQRDYGDDVLRLSAKLKEKQADLHVLQMIRMFNSDKSEDEMVSPEIAKVAIEKYINDRQVYFNNLTKEREQYAKGSEEYRDITQKRGRWFREIEAARRVAKELGLSITAGNENEEQF